MTERKVGDNTPFDPEAYEEEIGPTYATVPGGDLKRLKEAAQRLSANSHPEADSDETVPKGPVPHLAA